MAALGFLQSRSTTNGSLAIRTSNEWGSFCGKRKTLSKSCGGFMARKKKKNRMPPELVEAVRYRADNMCEVMNPDAGCTGRHEETHHRKMRSQQGKHTMENCVAACNACHGYIHRHPAIA